MVKLVHTWHHGLAPEVSSPLLATRGTQLALTPQPRVVQNLRVRHHVTATRGPRNKGHLVRVRVRVRVRFRVRVRLERVRVRVRVRVSECWALKVCSAPRQ